MTSGRNDRVENCADYGFVCLQDAITTRYPNTTISGINQYHNSRITGSATMREWETSQNGCKVRCAQG